MQFPFEPQRGGPTASDALRAGDVAGPIPFPGVDVSGIRRGQVGGQAGRGGGLSVVGPGTGLVRADGYERGQMLDRALRERQARIRAEVARENVSARGLGARDARRVLAVRTSEALEGGACAILRPDRRRRILDLAQGMGLRPFDANLIIAIVQDSARRGIGAEHEETSARLELVGSARTSDVAERAGGVWMSVAWAACAGLALAGVLIGWVLGAG